jgi:hypothetical protein
MLVSTRLQNSESEDTTILVALTTLHQPTPRNFPEDLNSAVPLWELQIGRQLHFITIDDILTISTSIVNIPSLWYAG